MALNVNTRPTTCAEARKRPSKANAKPKTKASVRFTIRELRDRCVAQLLGAGRTNRSHARMHGDRASRNFEIGTIRARKSFDVGPT